MPIDWSPFVEFTRSHQRFLLMTHRRPDGDGIGSQLALAEALRHLKKEARAMVLGEFPHRYEFLDPDRTVEVFRLGDPSLGEIEAVVILDTGTWNQLDEFGEFLKSRSIPTAVIDHHQTQDPIGDHRLVDVNAEATGRLVYEAMQAVGARLTPASASALFVAVATDTGWFRHANTTDQTFRLAERLVAAGADPTRLYQQLYERNTPERLRLVGVALERIATHAGGQLASTEIRQSDFADTGTTPADTDELINYPRSLAGVEVAVLLVEQPDGLIKISFRSRDRVDVGGVAERFGGGGHRRAAGALAEGSLDEVRRRVIDAIEPLVTPAP